MKKRLRKKWSCEACSCWNGCTKHEDDINCFVCKRYYVSQKMKKIHYRFCKEIRHLRTSIWHKILSPHEL